MMKLTLIAGVVACVCLAGCKGSQLSGEACFTMPDGSKVCMVPPAPTPVPVVVPIEAPLTVAKTIEK